jgi:succinate-semialdehyde dehydrogenase/glutarate-semialdehyde dehydrogenase
MSYQRVNTFQWRSVRQRCRIDGSKRAGESLASRAGKNLKKSTMELGGSDAFVAPGDRAQICRSLKQMHTKKADPQ